MKAGINVFARAPRARRRSGIISRRASITHQTEFSDSDGYARLGELLDEIDRERGTCGNRVFYLADRAV